MNLGGDFMLTTLQTILIYTVTNLIISGIGKAIKNHKAAKASK